MQSKKKTVTAQLPKELFERLDALAKAESRSKSYYIQKGVEEFLNGAQSDIEDAFEAQKRYKAFLSKGEKGKTLKEMKEKYAL